MWLYCLSHYHSIEGCVVRWKKINIWYFFHLSGVGFQLTYIVYIQVKTLKEQLEQKKKGHRRDESCSPEGEILKNSTDSEVLDMQGMKPVHAQTPLLLSLQGEMAPVQYQGYVSGWYQQIKRDIFFLRIYLMYTLYSIIFIIFAMYMIFVWKSLIS